MHPLALKINATPGPRGGPTKQYWKWVEPRTSRRLMSKIRKRQLRYVGHVLRGESLEKHCLMGMIEESRARGRRRIKYLDGIKTLIGVRNVGEVFRLAEDREGWCNIVANVNVDTAYR